MDSMNSTNSSNLPQAFRIVPPNFPDKNATSGDGGRARFQAAPGNQKCVLVVDDDPDILSARLALLQEAGFRVMGATTGRECLAAIHKEQPDLVLLDMNPPDISGLELCRRLKTDSATSGIPIVHLSGDRVSSEERAAELKMGADGYSARPLSDSEFIAKVRAALLLKRTEAELRQVTMELREQRMASIGMLADGIAHDLNTVLAPMLMGIHLLRQKHKDNASDELLSTMEFSARRGAALVEHILSFANGAEGQRSMIQPRRLITEAFETVMETLPKTIAPEMDLELNLWNITSDPAELRTVLLNLCANARDAMPQGGQLILSAANTVLDEFSAWATPGASSGPHVVIQVRDTGAGMSKEILERIFDPFFTTRDFAKGAGLGLSTSLGIIRSHGGFIQVQSEPGKGSTFKVHLPAAATGKLPMGDERRAEYARGNGELVMVVDDDQPIRTVTQQALEAFGYRVLLASNGSDAAAMYAGRQAEIAVVLMDMIMPVLDGPATIQMLASMNPEVRIIATSGKQSNQQVAKTISPTVKSFLPKPYNSETLLRAVASTLGAGTAAA
jgi:signal transduction histidine kinase